MIRMLIENILLFVLPTLAYLAYVYLARKESSTGRDVLADAPLLWLSVAGADPCDERAHRLAMRALVAAGESHLAHEQIERCRIGVESRAPHQSSFGVFCGTRHWP